MYKKGIRDYNAFRQKQFIFGSLVFMFLFTSPIVCQCSKLSYTIVSSNQDRTTREWGSMGVSSPPSRSKRKKKKTNQVTLQPLKSQNGNNNIYMRFFCNTRYQRSSYGSLITHLFLGYATILNKHMPGWQWCSRWKEHIAVLKVNLIFTCNFTFNTTKRCFSTLLPVMFCLFMKNELH